MSPHAIGYLAADPTAGDAITNANTAWIL
ncbi:MAG: hypothetical protein JWO27_2854, partial [Frankiales bacterium]|nr:hypothetical protein [Frankiales bacterium]